MTQNLELDLAGKTLTPEDSDVSNNWNYDSAGGNAYTSAQDGSLTSSAIQYYNLGKYVWKTPNSTSSCSPDTNFSESGCANYWQDASSMTPMTTYRTDGVSVDGNTYDAHYLAGNYYSWQAATAGTGSSATSSYAEATDSICPAGWQLPYSGTNSITRAPLFFVRSGCVNPANYLSNAGNSGTYWSSVANSSSNAYTLGFYSSGVSPSGSYNRYNGQSVRCVAPSA